MATFKTKVGSTSNLTSTYGGRRTVFLEGKTDVSLFTNHWFIEELDRIEFKEPDSGIGCTGVVQSVSTTREAGNKAFGIVDRDKLQADKFWDLVWETDDLVFSRARPYGEHVRVTQYWELESYLIDPEVIENHVALKDGGRRPRSIDNATTDCLSHAEVLIPHAALNSALRSCGQEEWGDGATSGYPTRADFEGHIEDCQTAGKIDSSVWKTYQENVPKVDAFANRLKPAEHLRGLLRRVNGKALIHRIKKKANLHDDPTFFLADAIRQRGKIPEELKSYLGEFAQA
jgi:hypothetical protein